MSERLRELAEAIEKIDAAESALLDKLLNLPVLGYAGHNADWPGSPLLSRPDVLTALHDVSEAIQKAVNLSQEDSHVGK